MEMTITAILWSSCLTVQFDVIMPAELVQYFCMKFYGIPEHGPVNNPTFVRHIPLQK